MKGDEIAGLACWGFRNVAPPPVMDHPPATTFTGGSSEGRDQEKPEAASEKRPAKILELERLSSGAMEKYQAEFMPEGAKCVFIIAISVALQHQGTGVGSSLLQWGIDLADKANVYSWVSSSDRGHKAFEKFGYTEHGRLDLCLDDYNELDVKCDIVANGVKDDGSWGRYVWRYMMREARNA